jgi:hypothetical protein
VLKFGGYAITAPQYMMKSPIHQKDEGTDS